MASTSPPSEFRRRRFELFLQLVDGLGILDRPVRVLDMGGTKSYWDALEPMWGDRDLQVRVVNLENEEREGERVSTSRGDARSLPFDDGSFDVVHSNSVLEHVGEWPRMQQMAAEVHRLAPHHYVQTPNLWFPLEPHFRTAFFQFLPLPTRAWMLTRRGLGFLPRQPDFASAMHAAGDVHLLGPTEMQTLFPDSRIVRERVAGLTKSITAIR